jgi:catecholate siderophore receptor
MSSSALHASGTWCCLLVCLLLTPVSSRAAAPDSAPKGASATYRFEIAPGPLDTAIDAFTHVTGARVIVPDGATITGLSSSGVTGIYTADQALAMIVSGTGLQSRLTDVGSYALEVRITTEGIQVDGFAAHEVTGTETATRTYTPLRNVPQAITVVTRAMIADQSMQSLADVVRYVPGVGMAQGEGNRDAAVFRGNSSTGDFFVDGIRDDVQYFRDLYNVDRVEALK